MSEANEYLLDFKLLDDAEFDANHRFVAETSIAALYFFKDLCKKKNCLSIKSQRVTL